MISLGTRKDILPSWIFSFGSSFTGGLITGRGNVLIFSNVKKLRSDPAVQKSVPLAFGIIVTFVGIIVFYITIIRLIWKFINPSPTSKVNIFKGQALIAKFNHFLLYLSVLAITTSGVLKKLYMGETLNFFFFKYGFQNDNFVLADFFYQIHIYSNYLLIGLIVVHIIAVIAHHVLFKDKILKKIT